MEQQQDPLDDFPLEGEKKIVVVGHKGCGKSSMVAAFVSECPMDMTETVPKDIRKTINFGRERVPVVLREEELEPEYTIIDRLQGTDAALVCFAFNDATSISKVSEWIFKMSLYCPNADLSVVGCKLDLKHQTAVSEAAWKNLERRISSYKYLECSAKTGEGVSHLVRVVGIALLNRPLQTGPEA